MLPAGHVATPRTNMKPRVTAYRPRGRAAAAAAAVVVLGGGGGGGGY